MKRNYHSLENAIKSVMPRVVSNSAKNTIHNCSPYMLSYDEIMASNYDQDI